MTPVFLDTGYVIALEAVDDQHHEEAIGHWRDAVPGLSTIVTTTYVFDEVVTFFNSRGRHRKAVEIGRRLRESQIAEIVQVGEGLFGAGWTRFQERPDKRYSLTDCISFVVMERREIGEALAFDRHFEQEGYRALPTNRGT
ncbi:type II toxin-antitoxin system VapC family toxin [Salinibacter ruber]|uniref:type II toxin-antitoxin system VapC family toxin n=1 Tax=Salinibacter ruber TaxID=146919 RepID=UPI000C9FFA40|nr:PIN domain-containing protein [Salinibacter ruber]